MLCNLALRICWSFFSASQSFNHWTKKTTHWLSSKRPDTPLKINMEAKTSQNWRGTWFWFSKPRFLGSMLVFQGSCRISRNFSVGSLEKRSITEKTLSLKLWNSRLKTILAFEILVKFISFWELWSDPLTHFRFWHRLEFQSLPVPFDFWPIATWWIRGSRTNPQIPAPNRRGNHWLTSFGWEVILC